MRTAALTAALGLGASTLFAAQPAPRDLLPERRMRFEDLPPAAQLGLRAEGVRRRVGVIPVVVVVPDAPSYAAAVSRWSVEHQEGEHTAAGARFPVLIDDGSWRAREDIARFVRGFSPRSVVRWSSDEAKKSWPEDPAGVRERVERSAYTAWGGATLAQVKEKWAALKFSPPGVVVASTADPAWTAALALAAGRGELFAWVTAGHDLSATMSVAQSKEINDAVGAACDAAGFAWKGLGDQIDAITLCLSCPAAVDPPPGDDRKRLATTDVIGRGLNGGGGKRWAWAAQVPGNEARAAYMAMCALFIEPTRAWLFDGYGTDEPWVKWDASAAAVTLEKAGLKTLLNDNGNQSEEAWRARAAGLGLEVNGAEGREPGSGIDAGFVCVNTSGLPEYFELRPGKALSGDVPFLHVPAAVHFVHSYSAARSGDRATIAGRFLERGAFAYVGAVHEPGLQAFIPTPLMVTRLLIGGAWGAAVRLDEAPEWKVAVFGDPLWVLGPPAPRVESMLPLDQATDLQEALSEALGKRDFPTALSLLSMMGRDNEVQRLVRLIAKDDPGSLTPEVAIAGVMGVFRSPGRDGAAGSGERAALLARLCTLIEPRYGGEPELRDIAWHGLYQSFNALTEAEIGALAAAVRPDQADRDAKELAAAAARSLGRDRVSTVLNNALPRIHDEKARRAVNEILAH